jgi:acetyl/propionyl-CoA carboxylase alpha subunit
VAKKYLIRHEDDETSSLEVREREGVIEVRAEGSDRWRAVQLERAGDSGLYLLMVDNRPVEIYLERRRGGALATIGRHSFDLDVGPWRPLSRKRRTDTAGDGRLVRITAPMTGSVVEVRCAPGDAVREGDVLLVIESMKMNNELRAPRAGTVETVAVKAGERVQGNALLVSLRPGES